MNLVEILYLHIKHQIKTEESNMEYLTTALPVIGIILAILLIIAIIGYVKAPPDQAYIISGLKKSGKILIGRAGIRIPFFERLDKYI